MNGTEKDEARIFLESLETMLNERLLAPAEMDALIRQTLATAKTDQRKHLNNPEAAFINDHVLTELSKEIRTPRWNLSEDEAQAALLNENFRWTGDISKGSPVRWEPHPFGKALNANADEIYQDWCTGALATSSPDFSLRHPFPHDIVFEAKYFPRGSLEYAQRQLVAMIYQAFFYRGLPRLPATKKHLEWSYEYASLIAYDASDEGTLAKAWGNLPRKTQDSFWEGANLYVMILRGARHQQQQAGTSHN